MCMNPRTHLQYNHYIRISLEFINQFNNQLLERQRVVPLRALTSPDQITASSALSQHILRLRPTDVSVKPTDRQTNQFIKSFLTNSRVNGLYPCFSSGTDASITSGAQSSKKFVAKFMAGFCRPIPSFKLWLKSKFNPNLPVLRVSDGWDSDMSAINGLNWIKCYFLLNDFNTDHIWRSDVFERSSRRLI